MVLRDLGNNINTFQDLKNPLKMEVVVSPETSEHSISTRKKEPQNKTTNKELFD
jgi:cell division protein FtsX